MNKEELIKYLEEQLEEINKCEKGYKISQKLSGVKMAYQEILNKLKG